MQRQSERHYTLDEYFSVEETSEVKHEFYNGEIFAMAGASRNHNRIAGNLFSALWAAVRGTPCEAFTSDMRLRTSSGLYTYPDVMVICGQIELSNDKLETVTNPVVLVEVLSNSTRDYDRGEKFTHYRSIPTLRDYLLIDQDTVRVEHCYLASEGEWRSQEYALIDGLLNLFGIDFRIPLSEIYDRVEFAAGKPSASEKQNTELR